MMSRASESATKTKKSDEGETQTSGTLSSKLFQLKKQIQSARFDSIKKFDEGETETSETLSSKLFHLKKQIHSARFDSTEKSDEGETETLGTLSSKLFHLKKQIQSVRFDSTEKDERETETSETLSSKLFHLKKQIQSARFDSIEKSDEGETQTSGTLSSKLFELKKQIQTTRFDSIKFDEGETETSGTLSSKLFHLKKQIQSVRLDSTEKADEGETEFSGTISSKLFHSTKKSDEGETETSGTLSSKLLHSTEKSDEGETETSVTLSSKLFHSTEKSEEGETETSGTLSSKLFHSTEKSDEGESETSGTLSSKLFHSTEKSDEGETETSGTLSSKLFHSTEKSDEGETETSGTLSLKLFHLKKQIQSVRFDSIKAKLKWNKKNLEVNTPKLLELARSRNNLCFAELNGSKNMLSLRIECPLCKLSGYAQRSGEKDNVNSQEVLFSLTIKLPHTEKIPPFTTWIFLDKNQRMAEDQSVFGRRQIYYDQYGGETLICSDSEEEIAEPKEEKHKFSEAEDQMLRKVFHEYGVTQEVLTILGQNIKATSSEFQDRFISLMERRPKQIGGSRKILSERNIFLDKSLTAALDSFDNLFCRRCLVFDCRLHGCSQDLIIPSEKQLYSCGLVENGKHCSNQCYLQTRGGVEDASESTDATVLCRIEIAERDQASLSSISGEPCPDNIGKSEERLRDDKRTAKVFSETVVISKSAVGALNIDGSILPIASAENLGKRKVLKDDGNMTLGFSTVRSDNFEGSASKMQKKVSGLDLVYMETEDQPTYTGPLDDKKQKIKHVLNKTVGSASKSYTVPVTFSGNEKNNNVRGDEANNTIHAPLIWHSSDSVRQCAERAPKGFEWKSIEKDLYLKGVEIFGKNSCLIARNLLSGLKTCKEVYTYMYEDGMSQKYAVLPNSCLEDSGKADTYYTDQVMPTRSRIFRRRGRARKLKYTGKSTGHPSIPKRIADGKNQSCKQYTPCGCKFMCGKQCPCHQNGTCCEKYCGCSKSCKNRFRGCHCAKSRCRSRQCPCFAAARECDPDVCRNCWVSCGDGSLDEPPAKGNGYQCGNMKLLLKQQQRILLAKSDVAGWGAFLRNPVNKNDYLGEYTGELISHREADKRGKIYDRANSSFLFDLNDQYVVDAYRKSNKLKFTNHSSNPNCYAKVMLVAGDHRVGIFAKEHIEASEELFYDYRYCPDQAPVWAQKPGSSKRDDSSTFHGRAQKHQSN